MFSNISKIVGVNITSTFSNFLSPLLISLFCQVVFWFFKCLVKCCNNFSVLLTSLFYSFLYFTWDGGSSGPRLGFSRFWGSPGFSGEGFVPVTYLYYYYYYYYYYCYCCYCYYLFKYNYILLKWALSFWASEDLVHNPQYTIYHLFNIVYKIKCNIGFFWTNWVGAMKLFFLFKKITFKKIKVITLTYVIWELLQLKLLKLLTKQPLNLWEISFNRNLKLTT